MGVPTFHFVDDGEATLFGEEEFWRDVEASDRLASALKADLYLRELCRTKAREDAMIGLTLPHQAAWETRERALLQEVCARGYRVLGSDGAPSRETRATHPRQAHPDHALNGVPAAVGPFR